MAYDPILIAPFKSGLSQYYKPFLIGNDAFVTLENCYSWRGSIKKREGSAILGRLPKVGSATGITNVSPPVVTLAAHGLLTGDMVWLENVLTTNGTISSITTNQFGPTVINTTGAHGMNPGQTVYISGTTNVILVDTSDGATFNNSVYTILSTTATTITISVSTTGTGVTGGNVFLGALEQQAFLITSLTANTFSLQNLNTGLNVPASGTAQSCDVYLPIVGTRKYLQSSTGGEQLIAFTPRKAFQFNIGTGLFQDISFDTTTAAITWQGTKDNFFYSSNFATVMWATNNIADIAAQPVGIRYYNGNLTAGWANHQPQVNGTPTYLNSALIILPYKGRLVALNTKEGAQAAGAQGNVNFFNRARWCQIGTPFVANAPTGFGTDANAWRDDVVGKGGFNDADTSEQIVSAEVIQDTLIVGFQFSTWRLRYTGNEILPFVWERIDITHGCESTFSTVAFDTYTLQISRRGIVAASYNNVQRIDLDIPDFVANFETGSASTSSPLGFVRIQSTRDFQKRLVYILYGDEGSNQQTPNKILVWNYEDNTWAVFDQSFTTLGQFKLTTDNTWSTWTTPWDTDDSPWNTPLEQQNTIAIVAGAKDSRVWYIMQSEIFQDNGNNYGFIITTNLINPYLNKGKRVRLGYYDIYATATDTGQITLENYTNDNDDAADLIKTVNLTGGETTKYFRVFLGLIGRSHQITLTMTPAQIANATIGASPIEIQGILLHTRPEGRIKQ